MTDIALTDIPSSCVGVCTAHQNPIPMTGKIVGQGVQFDCYGKEPALDQYTVQADCGHTGTISAGTSKITINGKKVAKVGDSFSGDFSGTVVLGQSKCQVA